MSNTTMSTAVGDVGVEIRSNSSGTKLTAEISGVGREEEATFTLLDSIVVMGVGKAEKSDFWSNARVFGTVGEEEATKEQKKEIEDALIIALGVSFPGGGTEEQTAEEDARRAAKAAVRDEIFRTEDHLDLLKTKLGQM